MKPKPKDYIIIVLITASILISSSEAVQIFPNAQILFQKSDQLLIKYGYVPKVTYKIGQKPPSPPPTLPLQQTPITMTYSQFLQKYKPNTPIPLDPSLYAYRQEIFLQNLKNINNHNRNTKNRFLMGVNEYADLTQKEFIAMYVKLLVPTNFGGGVEMGAVDVEASGPMASYSTNNMMASTSTSKSMSETSYSSSSSSSTTSSSYSWETPDAQPPRLLQQIPTSTPNPHIPLSYTTPPSTTPPINHTCHTSPVPSQGLCGSCFIIAPLESILITYRMYGQKISPLSVQEVLSCGLEEGRHRGCQGGYFDSAYGYNVDQGTGSAELYPYDARSRDRNIVPPCNTALKDGSAEYRKTKIQIKSAEYIRKGDCATVVSILQTRALAVSIDAQNLQFYSSGIFDQQAQNPNHGVTLVGYDPIRGYLIKNSWGAAWGLRGYGYVSKETGVCTYAMYPVTGVEEGGRFRGCG